MPKIANHKTILFELAKVMKNGALSQAVQSRDLGNALVDALKALQAKKETLRGLESLSQSVELISPDVQNLDRNALMEAAAEAMKLGGVLETANESNELREVSHSLAKIELLIKLISNRMMSAWQNRIRSEFRPHEKLAQVLARFSTLNPLAKRMANIAAKGRSLENAFPPAEQDREQFTKLLTERDEQLNELSRSDKGVDAQFLLKAAEGTANLRDLSPEILKWLSAQNALELFSVRLS